MFALLLNFNGIYDIAGFKHQEWHLTVFDFFSSPFVAI
jgi:hypothetical protein